MSIKACEQICPLRYSLCNTADVQSVCVREPGHSRDMHSHSHSTFCDVANTYCLKVCLLSLACLIAAGPEGLGHGS